MKGSIEAFIEYLQNERAASENTCLSYKRDLLKLDKFLSTNGECCVTDIRPHQLQAFIHNLEIQGFKATTISRQVASIKAFYHFLCEKRVLVQDISECLTAPKIEKKEAETITVNEAKRLLAQPDGDTPKELRDKAMLELLYATGIRITELLSLRLTDVDLCRGHIICHDGCGERIVPFGQNAMVSLLRYLHMGRESLMGESECREVFVNCKGKGMSRQGFWKLIKYYADKAELETEITPYTLKHCFVAHSMDK